MQILDICIDKHAHIVELKTQNRFVRWQTS